MSSLLWSGSALFVSKWRTSFAFTCIVDIAQTTIDAAVAAAAAANVALKHDWAPICDIMQGGPQPRDYTQFRAYVTVLPIQSVREVMAHPVW